MPSSSKRIGLMFISAATAVSLVACNSEKAAPEGQGEGVKQLEPPKEVELTLYSDVGDPEDEVNRVYIEPLQKKYPHIKMKYVRAAANSGTTMTDMLASSTKFDIFYHGRGPYEEKLQEFNLMFDMTELARKHNIDLSQLEPTAVNSIKEAFDGKLYGIPVTLNSLLVFYNKTIFDQFGVPYPKDGLTWEDTFELAKRMTRSDGQRQYYGFGMNGTAQFAGMNSLSIPFVDGKTNLPTIMTDERWKTLFQTVFMNPVMTETFASAKKIPNWASFSKDRNLAMILYTASVPNALEEELKTLDWDMTALPVFKNAPNAGSRANPIYFGVTPLSKHPDAAMEAIKFWTSNEYQVEMSKKGKLMASKSKDVTGVLGSESVFADKNWGAITRYPFTPLAPLTKFDNKVRTVYTTHLNTLMAGEADLNTALRLMNEEAAKVIKEELSR
ncbi:carbohydrate ABC transporter substrate-binding protein [Paenibacillus hemerocallicola]|uniref:Carbohydrate ABC transporter substrate-binding protein n=1 Tax=Paenibacillus hemerocallicola TaxID=1172614 RepID=A0A5C4SY37_9BACL|nr:ABC transporter substrate-binding protein [Paenibacillus hemerocallicola]TNJ61360.1 carbohydrate ABC transporter substrate-binding protein [Paenibacillus hemerocallicola]